MALGAESSKGHGVAVSTDVEVGGDFVEISVEGRSVYHEVRLGTACGCGVGWLRGVGNCHLSDPFGSDYWFKVCVVGFSPVAWLSKCN